VLEADWSAYEPAHAAPAGAYGGAHSGGTYGSVHGGTYSAGFYYGELNKTGGYGFDGNFWCGGNAGREGAAAGGQRGASGRAGQCGRSLGSMACWLRA
jgi:hypothetical protein